LSLERKDWYS